MKLRWLKWPLDDSFRYDLTPVELSESGKVLAWCPEFIVSLETMSDEPIFRDNLKSREFSDAVRDINGMDETHEELLDAVREAHMAYESDGCVDMELEMRMWGE